MNDIQKYALDTAKEITIAALSHGNCFPGDSGVGVADYFEIVYDKILELAQQAQD